MSFKGFHIDLAELAMALTALGALISAWRGGKAAKGTVKPKTGKGEAKDAGPNRDGD